LIKSAGVVIKGKYGNSMEKASPHRDIKEWITLRDLNVTKCSKCFNAAESLCDVKSL